MRDVFCFVGHLPMRRSAFLIKTVVELAQIYVAIRERVNSTVVSQVIRSATLNRWMSFRRVNEDLVRKVVASQGMSEYVLSARK